MPYYKDTKFNIAVKNIIASNEASDNSVDLFGMTSMYVLATSSRLSLELLRALLLKHQENLVTVDNWECLPVDYACTLNAPVEIIQLLLDTQLMVFSDRYSRLKWLEQKEAISLLELALWKAKLDISTSDPMQLNGSDRSKYRINCGDEIVISNVLPFLGDDLLLVEESE
jgi:hypothetical protein